LPSSRSCIRSTPSPSTAPRPSAGTSCPASGQKVYYGCKGYSIDHKRPICSGGKDAADNMQWLPVAMKRSKDRIEHAACECVRKHGAKACPTVTWP